MDLSYIIPDNLLTTWEHTYIRMSGTQASPELPMHISETRVDMVHSSFYPSFSILLFK